MVRDLSDVFGVSFAPIGSGPAFIRTLFAVTGFVKAVETNGS